MRSPITLIFVLLLSTQAPARQPVSGLVLDAAGQPAAKAVVQPINLAEEPAVTDEQGQFTVSLTELNSWESLQAFSADGLEHGKSRKKTGIHPGVYEVRSNGKNWQWHRNRASIG